MQVTDAMTLPTMGLAPYRELVRRVEGVAGSVPMRWLVVPRPGYGAQVRVERRTGVPVVARGTDALAVIGWDTDEPTVGDGGIAGRFTAASGEPAHIVLAAAHQEPLVLPSRDEVEARLAGTESAWRRWSDTRRYDGPWRDEVVRSGLALKLLVFAPSGAIAAAPDDIPSGGDRRRAELGRSATRGRGTRRSRSVRSSPSAVRPRPTPSSPGSSTRLS